MVATDADPELFTASLQGLHNCTMLSYILNDEPEEDDA